MGRGHQFPPQAIGQRQPGIDFPAILPVKRQVMDTQSDRIERGDIDFVSDPAQSTRDVAKEDRLAVIKWAVVRRKVAIVGTKLHLMRASDKRSIAHDIPLPL